MAATLSVKVCSFAGGKKEDIFFFSSTDLHADAEEKLLDRVREIISLSKHLASSCNLTIRVQTRDPEFFVFSVNKLAVSKTSTGPPT